MVCPKRRWCTFPRNFKLWVTLRAPLLAAIHFLSLLMFHRNVRTIYKISNVYNFNYFAIGLYTKSIREKYRI